MNIKSLSDWLSETKEQKNKIIMGARRSGKTGIQTITLINALPIPQVEKDRLIKIYLDEFKIMTGGKLCTSTKRKKRLENQRLGRILPKN